MVRISRERIADLFALAEKASTTDHPELADRYVQLARRIGMRYNIRFMPEYRELYCRGCSKFWVEGRTVRTRFRHGLRVRTCLACGRERRTPTHIARRAEPVSAEGFLGPARRDEAALVEMPGETPTDEPEDNETEEP